MTNTARRIAAWIWARRVLAGAILLVLAVEAKCAPYPDGHWG